jgi:Na+/H+ antiporter NhaD/arsenite permease-like protein
MGSASTLVAAIIHKHRLQMTFMDFVKLAAPFALIQIVVATVYALVFL